MGLYSESNGVSVPESLVFFIAYHITAPHHVVRGPCGEARASRVNSGINPGNLVEKVNSSTNPEGLAEKVNSGINPGDLTDKLNSGTNPGDLVEKVNSGMNPRDLAEKVNSGMNPGDLAERVNSGMNPEDLPRMANSGTNPGDLADRVNSGTNPEDLAEKVNSGMNPGDLAERANSGTNPRDLAERVNSGTNHGDLAKRVHLGTNPKDLAKKVDLVSRSDPEVDSSRASSGLPSLVDARVLRDLEVMKADPDLDTTVTEASLGMIKGRYSIPAEFGLHVPQPEQCPYSSDAPGMCISVDALEAGLWFPLHPLIKECLRCRDANRMDLDDLRGMPKMSSGKVPSTRVAAPAWEVDVSPAREAPKTSTKRPIDAPTGSIKDLFKMKVHKDDTGYYTLQMSDLGHQDPDKEMKAKWRGLKNSTEVWNDSSIAEEFERGLLHPQLARELYTVPSEVLLARAAKEMLLVSSQTLSRYSNFSF
ncbi:hypothetical protein B296_00025381 [Ensete ventricosum]|uniref:Uncharacterized protein n=1 Tax=Ensete ventricosum TaxID=4639 RepID=A0A426Y9D4_ENSVE|nr:hypothetical protein B296_00025381 [Ensete ventricosum]